MAEVVKRSSAAATSGTPTQIRRRAAALLTSDEDEALATVKAGPASGPTMMRLYSQDDNPGLKVDPVVVLALAVVFIFSVVFLHLFTKVARWYTK